MKKHCKHCFQPFEGRTNQLFCSAKCKNVRNNTISKERNSNLKRVFNLVKANRQALAHLYQLFGSQPVSRELVEKAGVRLAYTSQLSTKGIFVYDDFGLKDIGNNQFQIDKIETR